MDSIKFYLVNDMYGEFSNFSKHPVFIEHRLWKITEYYFQAQKFLEAEHQDAIHKMDSPMDAAKYGRRRDLPLRKDWEEMKDDIMREAVEAKIKQHADVRKFLISTGNKPIIESTKNDSYWADGGDGTGKNMFGIILMDLREKYRNYDDLTDTMSPPWIQYPDMPRMSIGWRMGYGEDFLDNWLPWYNGLSERSKRKYRAKFPEPEEWKGYYEEKKQ